MSNTLASTITRINHISCTLGVEVNNVFRVSLLSMTGLVGLILFHLHDSVRGDTMYWSSSVILAWHRYHWL